MASFINVTASNIGKAEVEVYEAVTKSILIGGNLANRKSTTVPVSVMIRKGTNDFFIAKDKKVDANDNRELFSGKIVLNAGDKIFSVSKVDASIDLTLSILTGVN